MAKVKGWLELYLWMNNSQQTDTDSSASARKYLNKDKIKILHDCKATILYSVPLNKEKK
ncbi:MAG: hypothetical protein HC912_07220 [Saprospiraceae bacterium]|nr:hypothetical protein [Saprospiraceae bacterium]